MNKPKAYLSFDIETDGPCVYLNSMLSVGITLITDDGNTIDDFSVNINKRPDAVENPHTMKEFWAEHPEAWDACHKNPFSPQDAMKRVEYFYAKWSNTYKLVWIAQPGCFDWMFLKNYYMLYNPNAIDIGYRCDCVSTLRDYAIKTKIITNKQYNTMVESLPKGTDHIALNDAKHQGLIFINLLKLMENSHKITNVNFVKRK
jgi:3'-5' exoribonuclease Rv2179c-like domain